MVNVYFPKIFGDPTRNDPHGYSKNEIIQRTEDEGKRGVIIKKYTK